MSSASGLVISAAKGSVALGNTFGTPIPSPQFKRIRVTGDKLKANYKTVLSKEILSTFRRKNYRRVGIDAGGSLGLEFIYGNIDDQLEALVYSTWQLTPQRFNAAADTQITDINTGGTGVITFLAAAAGDPNRAGTFAIGHLVRASGETTNPGNNFLKRATAVSATTVTVPTAGLVINAAPNINYRLKAVGVEAPAVGNISYTTAGLAAGSNGAIVGSGIDFVALGFVAGMWFKSALCPTAANNGWYRVLSVATLRLECDIVPTGFATDAAGAVQCRLYMPDYLRDGANAIVWFDLERQLPQLATPEYHYFLSQLPTTFDLDLGPQDVLNASMAFVGAKRTTGTARVATPTDLLIDTMGAIPRTGDIYDTSGNVAKILLGNTPLVDIITACKWSIDNNASGLPVIGNLGAGRILRPAFGPTLSITHYYDSRAILANLETDTVVSVSTVLTDPLGTRAFILDYPSAKILQDDMNDIVTDTELDAPVNFGAIENVAYGCQVQMMRFEEYA